MRLEGKVAIVTGSSRGIGACIARRYGKEGARVAVVAHSKLDKAQAVAEDVGAGGYLIGHSTPVYLIDRSGMLRVLHTDLTLDPQPLVQDIRLLLK